MFRQSLRYLQQMNETVNTQNKQDARIAALTFSAVYPHYLAKVQRKDRTKEELHQVIQWLTGYDELAKCKPLYRILR